MYSTKNNTIIIGILLLLIIFQVGYYLNSEKNHKKAYEKLLVNDAKIYFENIMLKKAQGLDPRLSIENELTHVDLELINEEKKLKELRKKIVGKEFYYFDEQTSHFFYYSIVNVQPNCIECHNRYNVGEVAGIVKILIDTDNHFENYKELYNTKYIYFILNILFTMIIIGLIVVFIKRTQQKHIELLRSQRNLEKAEKMADLGHWRIDNRTFELSFSKNMSHLAGLEETQSTDVEFILDKVIYHKDKFKLLRSFYRSLKNIDDIQIEFRIIHQKDQQKRFANCHITHILDKEFQYPIVSIGTIQDVSSFITLKNRLSILEQAVEQAPISIVITDAKGDIEYVNPTFIKVSGYEEKELIGKNPRIIKSEETKKIEYENLWNTINYGKNWNGIFKNIKKNGEEFWELALISPVISPKTNKIVKFLAIKEEITSKIYMKQQLKYQEELMIVQSRHAAMGEMISMIAHQWRQPATVISLCANNILTDIVLDDMDKDNLLKNAQDIIAQTQYLSDTIDDFRNFFKPNKQKSLESIKDIIKEVKVMMRATLSNNKIRIIENYSSDKKILTYKKEFVQVIINILKNAQEVLLEKNSGEKTIFISEYIKNNNVILSICDDAGGIENKNIDRIFEPYFSTKDEKNGTGLGLYISKTIVEKHLNGTIKAYNKDQGACFEIILEL